MLPFLLALGALALLPMFFDNSDSNDEETDPGDGGSGEETLPGGDGLTGTEDGDTISGTGGDDHIFGNGSGDTLYGGDLYPEQDGGTGDDTIFGGDGVDSINGGYGYDEIHGGEDEDILQGWNGQDTVYGGGGDDTIEGNEGSDLLYGGDGDDWFSRYEGNDTIFGGAGNDQIIDLDYIGNSVTQIDGGAGDDTIGFDGGSTISGGDGADQLILASELGIDGVTIINDFDPAQDSLRLYLFAQDGDGGDVSLVDWDNGLGADLYYGTDLVAKIEGGQNLDPADILTQVGLSEAALDAQVADGNGSSILTGNSYDNVLSGGDGKDVLSAGGELNYGFISENKGSDLLDGGDGDDTLSALGGDIQLEYSGDEDPDPDVIQTVHVDTLIGGAGDDLLMATNGGVMTGGSGEDVFGIEIATGDRAYGVSFDATVITDFDPDDDQIIVDVASLLPDTDLTVVVWADGLGADIMTGDIVLAQVAGGQSLTAADISVVQSLY